jgi:hypothetical protein
MENFAKQISDLLKTMEAGNYDAKPSSMVAGAAVQREDLSPKMENVCYNDKSIVLQKMLSVESSKSNTYQFVRQLSYGDLGGTAVMEGHIGPENTGQYARIVVPMGYYVDTRRVTEQALLVDTFDGKKNDEREAENAAKKIAADVEFACFRGADDFSNAGVFDGAPGAIPDFTPGMRGVFVQIRQSEVQYTTAQDQMFGEYGGGATSVVFTVGGTLTQTTIEDVRTRSTMNHGDADVFVIDPEVHGSYNKITQGKERIVLAGSPTEATGAKLNKQWTANGDVEIKPCRFLSGKTGVAPPRDTSPGQAATLTATSTTTSGLTTPFTAGQVYQYFVTAANEAGGEGPKKTVAGTVVATGDEMVLAIGVPASGTVRYFNVYRSAAGGTQASAKFIGRCAATSSGTGSFRDQGNKIPAFVTGALLQNDTMELREMAGFTRKKMAESNLTHPEVFYRFLCLAMLQPRKNCIVDNLSK